MLPAPRAAKDDLIRTVDESGEDYFFHKAHFVFVDFPPAVRKRILEVGADTLIKTQAERLR